MTVQKTKKAIKPDDTTQADDTIVQSERTLLHTVYTIAKAYPYFHLDSYNLYSDNTWEYAGPKPKETLPMSLDRLNALSLKRLGKL